MKTCNLDDIMLYFSLGNFYYKISFYKCSISLPILRQACETIQPMVQNKSGSTLSLFIHDKEKCILIWIGDSPVWVSLLVD